MKNKKSLSGYIILFILLVISVISILFFGNKGASLVINLVFAAMMFGILIAIMGNICRYVAMIDALKKGTDYIETLSQTKLSAIKDGGEVFPSNDKLSELLTAYYRDNSGFDGDIADYITEEILEEEINKQVSELAAGAMTGLGLLGTFVGLMIGIKDLKINQDQLMESIKTLMDGMKTAFLTSIFGVIYSLVFNTYYKHVYSWGVKELYNFYDAFYKKIASNPDNKNLNRIIDNQKNQIENIENLPKTISIAVADEMNKVIAPVLENQKRQSETFEKMSDSVAVAVAGELNKVFSPTINKMDDMMEKFVSIATANQKESLALLVNSFVDSMNEVLNDKFVLLGETLDKTCEYQTANFEMMDKVVTTITSQTSRLSELNESIENSLDSIQNYEQQIEKFNENIINHNDETHKLITDILDAQNRTLESVTGFSGLVKNATECIDQVKGTIDEQKNIISQFSDKSIEIINHNYSTMERINKNTDEVQTNIINKISSKSAEVIEHSCDALEQVNKNADEMQKNIIKQFSEKSIELINKNKDTFEMINTNTNQMLSKYSEVTSNVSKDMNLQVEKFAEASRALVEEIKTVGSRIHLECNGLESSLGTSLNSTLKVFDENLAEITTHLNSSIKEMQELVDRLPRDLYMSIGKLKESMDSCVSLLNNYNSSNEGNQ